MIRSAAVEVDLRQCAIIRFGRSAAVEMDLRKCAKNRFGRSAAVEVDLRQWRYNTHRLISLRDSYAMSTCHHSAASCVAAMSRRVTRCRGDDAQS